MPATPYELRQQNFPGAEGLLSNEATLGPTLNNIFAFYKEKLERRRGRRKYALQQAILGEAVDVMTQINLSDSSIQEKARLAVLVRAAAKPYFGESWKVQSAGIMGEVCVSTALKEHQVTVTPATPEEDLRHKIDMWANLDGYMFAVQVKCAAGINAVNVFDLRDLGDRVNSPGGTDMKLVSQVMGEYLSGASREKRGAIPVLVEVPGGSHNERTAFNIATGMPTEKAGWAIYDGFEDIVTKEEDK